MDAIFHLVLKSCMKKKLAAWYDRKTERLTWPIDTPILIIMHLIS